MKGFEILIISIGLSLDVFAYSLWKGAMMLNIKKKELIKLTLIFCSWQMFSIYLGKQTANIPIFKTPTGVVANGYGYFSVLIFLTLGLYMILKGRNNNQIIERVENNIDFKQAFIWAMVTSINAFLAGFGLALFSTDIYITLLIHGIVVGTCVIMGVYTGYRVGCQSKNKIVTVGGFILVMGALELLFQRLL